MSKKIGFIGGGNMGGAIIGGIISSKFFDALDILVYDKNAQALKNLNKTYGINTDYTLSDVIKADIIFLSIKPNIIYSVIDEIKGTVNKNAVIVSIAAGQSIEKLTKAFENPSLKLVRVMPNTPALVKEGMSAVSLNDVMQKRENKEDVQIVMDILTGFGKAEIVPETLMDTVTGVSGSSPAYIFMLIEAMADAAVMGGMPRNQAYTFAAQSVLGSAKMVLELDKHPGELKDMVCSPGGTTIEAVKILENDGFRSSIMNAIDACIKKSKSL